MSSHTPITVFRNVTFESPIIQDGKLINGNTEITLPSTSGGIVSDTNFNQLVDYLYNWSDNGNINFKDIRTYVNAEVPVTAGSSSGSSSSGSSSNGASSCDCDERLDEVERQVGIEEETTPTMTELTCEGRYSNRVFHALDANCLSSGFKFYMWYDISFLPEHFVGAVIGHNPITISFYNNTPEDGSELDESDKKVEIMIRAITTEAIAAGETKTIVSNDYFTSAQSHTITEFHQEILINDLIVNTNTVNFIINSNGISISNIGSEAIAAETPINTWFELDWEVLTSEDSFTYLPASNIVEMIQLNQPSVKPYTLSSNELTSKFEYHTPDLASLNLSADNLAIAESLVKQGDNPVSIQYNEDVSIDGYYPVYMLLSIQPKEDITLTSSAELVIPQHYLYEYIPFMDMDEEVFTILGASHNNLTLSYNYKGLNVKASENTTIQAGSAILMFARSIADFFIYKAPDTRTVITKLNDLQADVQQNATSIKQSNKTITQNQTTIKKLVGLDVSNPLTISQVSMKNWCGMINNAINEAQAINETYKLAFTGNYDVSAGQGTINAINGNTNKLNLKFEYLKLPSSESPLRGSALETLNVKCWDISRWERLADCFNSCSNLKRVNVENWDTSKIWDMSRVFQGCENLRTVDVSKCDTTSATSMNSMFKDCRSLRELDVSNWVVRSVNKMLNMFDGCSSLQSLDLNMWDVRRVENFTSMFSWCSSLTSLDLSNWYTDSATNMSYMFYKCSNLQSLDISNFHNNNERISYVSGMFNDCSALTEIICSKAFMTLLTDEDNTSGLTCPSEILEQADSTSSVKWTVSNLTITGVSS